MFLTSQPPLRLAMIAAVYFVLGYAGLQLPYFGTTVTLVWAPAGVALGAMLIYGTRIWPAIFCSALLVNLTTGTPVLTDLLIAAGNTLSAVAGTWMLRHFNQDGRLTHSIDILLFILLGAIISPLIAAANGAAALCLTAGADWSAFTDIARGWWLGDGVGILFFGPLTLSMVRHPWHRMSILWYAEAAVLLMTAGIASLLVHHAETFASPETLYIFGVIPFLIWGAVRCGMLGVTAVNALSVGLSILVMSRGTSAVFTSDDVQGSIQELYGFQIFIAVIGLALGAYIQRFITAHGDLDQAPADETASEPSSGILVAGAAGVGITLSVVAALVTSEQIRHTKSEDAYEQALRLEAAIRHETGLVFSPLFAIKTLFEADKAVTRKEFETYISPWLEKTPAVQALEWVARVSPEQRDSFEQTMRRLGYDGYEIVEKDGQNMVRAPARDIYFPVAHLVPFEPNRKALGFAPANLPTRRNAIKQALGSRGVAMSDVITLVQHEQKHNGLLIFLPTFAEADAGATPENTGFALGIYNLDTFFETLFQRLPASEKVNIRITDYEENGAESVLYDSIGAHVDDAANHDEVSSHLDMHLAGQNWRLDVHPKTGAHLLGYPFEALGVLTLGLLLTTAMTIYLYALHRRRDAVQALVDRRTQELSEAKGDLEQALTVARDANKAKSLFLAQMSHELRTPLNAIIGYVDLLLTHPHGPLGHSLYDSYLQNVKQAGRHLHNLVGDVLDLAKIEADNLELEHVPFRLIEIIDELRSVFSISAAERNNRLTLHIAENLSENFLGDPTRLRQVLTNLLSNAVKFTENGDVTLRVEVLSDAPKTQQLKISVTDTGIGIDPDQTRHLFDNFAQADSSIQRRYGGSGMGLAISKKLVEAMKGKIGVDSQPQRGSTFWVILPLDKARAADQSETPPDKIPVLRPLTLLLADDAAMNRAMTVKLLGAHGHRTDVATNGREAVDAVKRKAYDAILMDVHMPEMDGMEATREIRALPDPQRAATPIIALTADVDQGNLEKFAASGMDDICPKPLDIQKLLAALQRHVPAIAEQESTMTATDTDQQPAAGQDFAIDDQALQLALEMVPDTATLFEQEAEKQLRSLRDAVGNQDWHQVVEAAHTLKGVSSNIGLKGLSRECQALISRTSAQAENDKVTVEPADIQEQIARIEQGYQSARRHIQAAADKEDTSPAATG